MSSDVEQPSVDAPPNGHHLEHGDADGPVDVTADEEGADASTARSASPATVGSAIVRRAQAIHPAAWLTGIGAVAFAVVFGKLGVQNHRNFGTWAFDMGIYDQAFWLVSRGQSWITVRGIDFWGHHFNPIALAFAPFYWLGAGPGFLYVAQASALGAAAIPVYLLARDRLRSPWVGLAFAVVYLLYAPIQWIAWANFHPEALVVTPFLFAWWFGTQRRWTGCFVSLVIALSTREDVALAVIVMGGVLWWWLRRHEDAPAAQISELDETADTSATAAASTGDTGATATSDTGATATSDTGATATSDTSRIDDTPTVDTSDADTTGTGNTRATATGDTGGAGVTGTTGTRGTIGIGDSHTATSDTDATASVSDTGAAGEPTEGSAPSPDPATVGSDPDSADAASTTARRRDRRFALAVSLLGVVWYIVATRLLIPAFNRGLEPFYIEYFYGHYGSNTREVVQEVMSRPDRVVSDATQPDRLRFYRDLLLPWGGLPLGGLVELAMAGPQLLASVIGTSPYARSIRYQYTAVMIAPIAIAAIETAGWMWRYRLARRYLVVWLLVCAYITNVAWSPSPISANDDVWAEASPRHAAMRDAVDLVPEDASVTATYLLLPHLSHREQIYNWPNPWVPSYWSNDDTYRLPDPAAIDYVVLDRLLIGGDHADLLDSIIGPNGDYEVVFDRDDIVVARRR